MRQAMLHHADQHYDMNLNQKQLESMIKEVDVVMEPKNMDGIQEKETNTRRTPERIISPNVLLTWSRSDLSLLPINDFPEDGRPSR